jgi:thiamine biosynthesis protein ThiS
LRQLREGADICSPLAVRYISCMQLFVNGDEKNYPNVTTLAQLIVELGMKGDRVAVELNREIVPRAQWDETQLRDGDRLEIVHFVGGG